MDAGLRLPGDGFEETEADEKANGGGEEDGPGVGGEAEGGTSAWGGHDGVSLKESAAPMKNTWELRLLRFLEKRECEGETSYNNSGWA
jgi:hypothetical protein